MRDLIFYATYFVFSLKTLTHFIIRGVTMDKTWIFHLTGHGVALRLKALSLESNIAIVCGKHDNRSWYHQIPVLKHTNNQS